MLSVIGIGVKRLRKSSRLQEVDLVDLLSKRYQRVIECSEQSWKAKYDISFSQSEWSIMTIIYKKQKSISYLTRNIAVSRQAIHKSIKNLSNKEIVHIFDAENNKKEKCIKLTGLGEQYYEEKIAHQAELENKVASNIGFDQLNILKKILSKDWGI